MTAAQLRECHLTEYEIACHDVAHTPYPARWRESRLPHLVLTFASLRQALGDRPLTVTSGYRTPEFNRRQPGALPNSQHVQGRALDVAQPAWLTVQQFHAAVREWAASGDAIFLGAVGYYEDFVHIDTRLRHVATWGRCLA